MNVADIAKIAVDAVGGVISDSVRAGVLHQSPESIGSVYDVVSGRSEPLVSAPATYACRVVVETDMPPARAFPEYEVAPGDQVVFIEGAKTAPVENWTLVFGGATYTVLRVQGILGTVATFRALVRAIPPGEEFA